MKEPIYPANAPRPIAPYSPAVRCPATAATVYVSGQLGADPATGELPAGVEAQAEQALRNLETVLVAAGCSRASVVKVTVFLKDMGDFASVNVIYGRFFPEPYPARTAIEVARLPRDAMIEIEAIALVED